MKSVFHCKTSGGGRAWPLAGLALAGIVVSLSAFAQTGPASSQTSGSAGTLAQFQQEQQALFQQWQTLVSQGATQQQLAAWQQQNAAQFQAQQQLAQALSAASALQPMPLISQVNIPANAPPTLSDFLTTQASLANARAQIHNQLLQALPAGATQQQIDQMRQQEMQTF
jgi:hypothetical protein